MADSPRLPPPGQAASVSACRNRALVALIGPDYIRLLPGAKLRFGDRRSIESRKAMPAGVTGGV
jgi:hypothetical protein